MNMDELKHIEIVVVEDDDADAEFILRSLRRQKLAREIHLAHDGQEAIDFFQRLSPQIDPHELPRLVLLDLNLPRVGGFEVLRVIKSSEHLSSIPVVVFSSSAEEQDIERAYALGANSYVQKPIVYEQFAIIINQLASYWLLANLSVPQAEIHAGTQPHK
jgi:two-component system response regulator